MKKTIKIPFEIKVNITNAVIKKLGVKDYFKLKDRLDGMFYLSKQCMRIYSSYCIQEIFKISLIDEKKPLYCKSQFVLNSENILIVSTKSPLKIKIPKKHNIDYYFIVHVNEDLNPPKTTYLGKISREECLSLNRLKPHFNSNSEVTKKPLTIISKENLYD